MEWLTHMIALFVGFVLGILFAKRNQKKVVKALKEEYKLKFEEHKRRK